MTVDCRSSPYVVTFDADEGPYDENTDIMIGVYDGKHEGESVWRPSIESVERACHPTFRRLNRTGRINNSVMRVVRSYTNDGKGKLNDSVKPAVVAVVALAIAAAGGLYVAYGECGGFGGGAAWTLGLGASEAATADDGSFVFRGDLRISGTGDPEVRGVRVVFLDADNRTLDEVAVAALTTEERNHVRVTANLSRPPERILVTVESVRSPDDADWWITGLRRYGDGYSTVTLREDPTPGYCGVVSTG